MNIRIDPQELYVLMFLLQISNKCGIDVVCQDDRILSLGFEHINVLALLHFIGHVIDAGLLFFFIGILSALRSLCCVCILAFTLFDHILQSQILVIQILVDHGVFHLLAELLVFEASELDERADIVPVFLIILAVCLEHADQFVRHFLGNIIRHLVDKAVVLQRASGYIQRQVRTVDDAL